jgi:NADP-dependent aldehyde dehydrogenase
VHSFPDANNEEINQALLLAEQSFHSFRNLIGQKRSSLLIAIANGLEQDKERIISVAENETHLGLPRLKMEFLRTLSELHNFAKLADSMKWKELSSEFDNHGVGLNSNLKKENLPVGPVLVIGACNFPFAISVVGTDTASALAVGCPVIVKSHPDHEKTCQALADIVKESLHKLKIPQGVFQILHGRSHRVTQKLVEHPDIKSVAFTGSLRGGSALAKIAKSRQKPVPFHAEMGSLNPVIGLPHRVNNDEVKFAFDYIKAVNLFAGQMCTKPGVLFVLDSNKSFSRHIKEAVKSQEVFAMLSQGVYQNYESSIQSMKLSLPLLATNEDIEHNNTHPAFCRIFKLEVEQFINSPELRAEAFGPSSMVVCCRNENELMECLKYMDGSLTGSIHAEKADLTLASKIIPILESLVGRIIWNGFPPGVIPGIATHHGGPWPATTDSRFTSIGVQGYKRFVRPICKQGFPD